jgi:transcription elongation factor Elf1
MITLSPCPFCGETPATPACLVLTDPSGKWGAIECTYCGARSPDVRTQYQPVEAWGNDAANEWNRREVAP